MSSNALNQTMPAQHQDQQPGIESEMVPRPDAVDAQYKGSGKLKGKVAIITGGDSGIGKATAVCFAKEGASIVIVYLNEDSDAQETQRLVEAEGVKCLLLSGDVGDETFCRMIIQKTIDSLGKIDILVNNAGEQHPQKNLEEISTEQLLKTFRTNFFSSFI